VRNRPAAARLALLGAGHAFAALGFAGAFLPLLPTTPFLLLAAACYLRSSERHHLWLMRHPVFGPSLRAYQEQRALPPRVKRLALVLLWTSLGFSAWRVSHRPGLMLLLAAVGVACSAYLLFKVGTLRPADPSAPNEA